MSQILHVAFHYLSKNSDFTGCPVVYLVNADLSPDQRKLCVCISILVSRPDALPNLPSANCVVQCPEMCPCLLKTC